MAGKKFIYLARTYRRTQAHYVYAIIYTLFIVIPILILLIVNLDTVTYMLSSLSLRILSDALPQKSFSIRESGFAPFGITYCLSFDSRFPTSIEILINLLVVVSVVFILVVSSLRGRPVTVYLLFSFMVHIISCVYFTFEQDNFVYTATEFSDIFVKQQISIWLLFIVMMGAVTALIGRHGFLNKILAFFGLLIYSLIFGVIRYIVFMFILAAGSLLYMADMYFVFGPIFDFLYLVSFYCMYTNVMQKKLDSPEGEGEWKWL